MIDQSGRPTRSAVRAVAVPAEDPTVLVLRIAVSAVTLLVAVALTLAG